MCEESRSDFEDVFTNSGIAVVEGYALQLD